MMAGEQGTREKANEDERCRAISIEKDCYNYRHYATWRITVYVARAYAAAGIGYLRRRLVLAV